MADGALLCSGCGQVFSTGAALARPMSAQVVSSAPRVHYGGFWLRFLAYLIDGAVITLGAFVVAIPLVFLTGLGTLLSQVHPEEDLNDAGFWLIMAVILLLAAVSLAVTWLYHALMESSEWQATIGKKVLDLLAYRGLPLGALHQRVIEPGHGEAHRGQQKDHRHNQPESGIVKIFLRMDLAQKRAEAGEKDQRNRNNKSAEGDHRAIDEVSQKPQPESAIVHSRG